MAWLFEIRSDDGTLVREFQLWMKCAYVDAADPSRCDPVATQIAYCPRCHDFVHAEQFLTPAECERIIEQERSLDEEGGDALRIRETLYGSHEQFATQLRIEALRMPGRKSPPRCLICGTTEIFAQQSARFFEISRILHPDYLPRGLEVRGVGHTSTALGSGTFERFYDREGNEVSRSAK